MQDTFYLESYTNILFRARVIDYIFFWKELNVLCTTRDLFCSGIIIIDGKT